MLSKNEFKDRLLFDVLDFLTGASTDCSMGVSSMLEVEVVIASEEDSAGTSRNRTHSDRFMRTP